MICDDNINLISISAIHTDIKKSLFETDKEVQIEIILKKKETPNCRYDFTLQVKDSKEQVLFPIASSLRPELIPTSGGQYNIKCVIPKNLFNTGSFYFNLILIKNKNQVITRLEDVININYTPPKLETGDFTGRIEGFLRPHFNWTIH